jgi:glycosyltransferase involved in cell wall biosynthesis
MRVALLNPCFFPEVRRGSERMIRELANALVASGAAQPRLITSHPGRTASTVEDGLRIVRHWRPPEAPLRSRGYMPYVTHLPLEYASLTRGEDGIAHAFYPTDALAAARWGERTGRPTVFTYMGNPTREVLASKRGSLKVVTGAVKRSSAVVALSHAAARGLERWLGVEARVIHPSVDLRAFSQAAPPGGPPAIFCPAASDDRRKRVDLLVAAFRRVRREHPEAVLMLMRPRDARRAAELASEPGIELVDPVDTPEGLAPIYAHAWVTALASYSEAFGIVMIESLATGRPIVGRDDGGIPEIVGGDEATGRLFSGDDETALARALVEAIELAAIGDATVERCRHRAEGFSTAALGKRHLELYRELTGQAGATSDRSAVTALAGTPAMSHSAG